MAAKRTSRKALIETSRNVVCTLLLLSAYALGQPQDATRPSIHIQIQNRFLAPGSECVFAVEPRGVPESARSEGAANLKLRFPGFSPLGKPSLDAEGKILLSGKIHGAGFFPFEVSLAFDNEFLTAQDYFVVSAEKTPATFDHVGYYTFLARGDYWDETHKLALWRLEDWEDLVDWMSAHQMDTLFMLLNGYTLAYPSEKYPKLRDPYSLNVKFNFLQKLVPYAHSRGVRIFLTMTTDDHAEGFGRLHPEAVRIDRDGHERAARALDLENPLTQEYIRDIFEEALKLYPQADGIVIHPTEADPDRFNDDTRALFLRETGKQLAEATKDERYRWYNHRYAEFVVQLYNLATAKNPNLEMVMFNCWWQDDYVSIYKQMLPEKMKICVWYYGWGDREFRKWAIWNWTAAFGSSRILYMPAGVAFEYPQDSWQQMSRNLGTDRLISTAEALGIKSCIFFDGWDLGTERERLRDLALTQFPTSTYVSGREQKLDLIKKLYNDYFGARKEVLH
jgi:hypothetical protein